MRQPSFWQLVELALFVISKFVLLWIAILLSWFVSWFVMSWFVISWFVIFCVLMHVAKTGFLHICIIQHQTCKLYGLNCARIVYSRFLYRF